MTISKEESRCHPGARSWRSIGRIRSYLMMSDDIRDMLERGWRAVQGGDEALSRGEIDEASWYKAMQDLVIPKYIAAENPRAMAAGLATFFARHPLSTSR